MSETVVYFHPLLRGEAFKQWKFLHLDTKINVDMIENVIWTHTEINPFKEFLYERKYVDPWPLRQSFLQQSEPFVGVGICPNLEISVIHLKAQEDNL